MTIESILPNPFDTILKAEGPADAIPGPGLMDFCDMCRLVEEGLAEIVATVDVERAILAIRRANEGAMT